MHEFSLMQDVIDTILQELRQRQTAPDATIQSVNLTVGALDIHSRDAFGAAFTALAAGTPLEGATLNLTVIPGAVRCDCGYDAPLPEDQGDAHDPAPVAPCPACGAIRPILGGRGITRIELDLV